MVLPAMRDIRQIDESTRLGRPIWMSFIPLGLLIAAFLAGSALWFMETLQAGIKSAAESARIRTQNVAEIDGAIESLHKARHDTPSWCPADYLQPISEAEAALG